MNQQNIDHRYSDYLTRAGTPFMQVVLTVSLCIVIIKLVMWEPLISVWLYSDEAKAKIFGAILVVGLLIAMSMEVILSLKLTRSLKVARYIGEIFSRSITRLMAAVGLLGSTVLINYTIRPDEYGWLDTSVATIERIEQAKRNKCVSLLIENIQKYLPEPPINSDLWRYDRRCKQSENSD